MIDIDGFRNYLYEEELSQNTIATYIKGLEMYAERYNEITKPNLIEFKRYLLENFKSQTVNLRITALTNYCKYKRLPERIKPVEIIYSAKSKYFLGSNYRTSEAIKPISAATLSTIAATFYSII